MKHMLWNSGGWGVEVGVAAWNGAGVRKGTHAPIWKIPRREYSQKPPILFVVSARPPCHWERIGSEIHPRGCYLITQV